MPLVSFYTPWKHKMSRGMKWIKQEHIQHINLAFLLLTLNMFLPLANSMLLTRIDFQNVYVWFCLLCYLELPDINGSFTRLITISDITIKKEGILKIFVKHRRRDAEIGGIRYGRSLNLNKTLYTYLKASSL